VCKNREYIDFFVCVHLNMEGATDAENNVAKKARLFSQRSSEGSSPEHHGAAYKDSGASKLYGEPIMTSEKLERALDNILKGYGLDNLKEQLESLKSSLDFAEASANEAKVIAEKSLDLAQCLQSEVEALKRDLAAERSERLNLACRQRRDNLRVYGLPEKPNERDWQTEEIFLNFLRDKYEWPIEHWFDCPIERCHRMGRRHKDHEQSPRPIIVKFTFFKDRDYVWRNKSCLAGSKIFVKEDFPPEIEKRVNIMMPIFKAAKRNGFPKAKLVVDKLYLNDAVMYTVETINWLPDKLHPENISTRVTDDNYLFYRKDACFSNFHPAKQKVNNVDYNCNEQFFCAEKARIFKDEEALKSIMASDEPAFQKRVRIRTLTRKYGQTKG
jgi:hypothetical protein